MHRRYFFSLCKIDEKVENEKFKNVTETLKKMAKREGTTVKIQIIWWTYRQPIGDVNVEFQLEKRF